MKELIDELNELSRNGWVVGFDGTDYSDKEFYVRFTPNGQCIQVNFNKNNWIEEK